MPNGADTDSGTDGSISNLQTDESPFVVRRVIRKKRKSIHKDDLSKSRGSSEEFSSYHREKRVSNATSTHTECPIDNFLNWVYCICVVNFDLELGQTIEKVFPADQNLSEKDRSNICYLSFPDSNSGLNGDTQYTFRFRQSSSHFCEHNETEFSYSRHIPPVYEKDSSHFYGTVYFNQLRDPQKKRGYQQKSLVLISRLPYVTFFTHTLELIAKEYFRIGETALLHACRHINTWYPPIPGTTLDLNLYDVIMRTRIPVYGENSNFKMYLGEDQENGNLTDKYVIPNLTDISLSGLNNIVQYLPILWELIILNEPVVIMANDPSGSSDGVLAMVNLISPLKYQSEFRPYFTIHDSEYKEFTGKEISPPSCCLGVTNPFFVKQLPNWPHILKIHGKISEEPIIKLRSLKKLQNGFVESKAGLYSEYKPNLTPDSKTIASLCSPKNARRPQSVQDAVIKKFFAELTTSFIMPLERYVASLMPLRKEISSWRTPPTARPFNAVEFLTQLKLKGPQLTSKIKGNWENLYQKFIRSPNFFGWLEKRERSMKDQIFKLHLESMSSKSVVVNEWKEKSCVEQVDQILRFSRIMKNLGKPLDSSLLTNSEPDENTVTFHRIYDHDGRKMMLDKMKNVIDIMIEYLPDDTKNLVRNAT